MYTGKVIDFHIHIGKKGDWRPWVLDYLSKNNPNLFQNFENIMNPNGLEDYLDYEGINYAVILAEDSPLTTGIVSNDYVYNFCKNRNKFISFASFNPITTKNPKKIIDKLVKNMDFRGLKFYPPYQHFYPNDHKFYPIYEKALEFNIPIMFHTGSSVYKNSKIKYGDPLHLDEVASDFPELKIIMAHSGRGFWYDIAFFLSKIHKNLYMEISGLPPQKLLQYFPNLENNKNKVIFGSDWPSVKSIKKNIESICSLSLKQITLEKIFYENAKKILKLK